MYYEGGIRVPMIALWPGVIESGSVCEEPVMQIDLFPTYLELAKAKIEKELDGENLLSAQAKPGVLSESRFIGICQVIWTEPNLARGIKTSAHDRLVSFEKEDGNFISTMKSGYLMAEEKKLRLTERSSFIIWTMTSQSKTMFHLKKRLLGTSYWMNFSLGKRK